MIGLNTPPTMTGFVNVAEKRFLKLLKSIHDEGRPGLVLEKPHGAADGRVKHIH